MYIIYNLIFVNFILKNLLFVYYVTIKISKKKSEMNADHTRKNILKERLHNASQYYKANNLPRNTAV
jgi:uncharacterized membrane protein